MAWIWTSTYNWNKKRGVPKIISLYTEQATVISTQQFLSFRLLLFARILIFLSLKSAAPWNTLLNDLLSFVAPLHNESVQFMGDGTSFNLERKKEISVLSKNCMSLTISIYRLVSHRSWQIKALLKMYISMKSLKCLDHSVIHAKTPVNLVWF